MTLPGAEKLSAWLAKAPIPTLVLITLTTIAALSGWVMSVAGDVSDSKASIAAAVERASAAATAQQSVDRRLNRLEWKIDKIVDRLGADRPSAPKEKTR